LKAVSMRILCIAMPWKECGAMADEKDLTKVRFKETADGSVVYVSGRCRESSDNLPTTTPQF